jgi:hypothetical protein
MIRTRPFIATVAAILVAPAILFAAVAVGRVMQPVQYQPARAAELIFEAFAALPGPLLFALLIAAPLIALALAAVVLRTSLRADASLRGDLVRFAWSSRQLLRHGSFVVAAVAAIAAVLFLLAVAIHQLAG